jgi:glycosyltransferase involved in cell wall biosynthesis
MRRAVYRSGEETSDAALHAGIDNTLPFELAVGGGTVLFVAGWCFCASDPVVDVAITVGDAVSPTQAHGMLRRDVALAHGNRDVARRSGFWGMARVPPTVAGTRLPVSALATLRSGREEIAPIAHVTVVDGGGAVPPPGPSDPQGPPLVAICMATYEVPRELFARQIASLRAQTHARWRCIISDDRSGQQGMADLHAVVGDDERFEISRSTRRLGFYENFERALRLAPPEATYVALADQDDHWHPDKLATLIEAIGDAELVYSDARIVDPSGTETSPTYWTHRRPNHDDPLSLLVANSVSGSALMIRRELLDDALPFPPHQFLHYHDHWLALVARARGPIAFVERPLYDYVQHADASLGHAAANQMPDLRGRLAHLRHDPAERLRLWRWHYFVDACRLLSIVAILFARCEEKMEPETRARLRAFQALDRSTPQLARLAARGAREILGLRAETLGAEWMLAHAFAWRRMAQASAAAGDRLAAGRAGLGAAPPSDLVPRSGGELRGTAPGVLADKVAPLVLRPTDDGPPRVNLLLPTFDLAHLFGGYIAKFNLARRLAERGARVRLVSVDPVGPLPGDWKRQIESYAGLAGLFDLVEPVFGREAGLDVGPGDTFIATTWWTAHIAHAAAHTLGRERIGYLIQEYEPFTFPMGAYAALAHGSYALPHVALFSTELLRDWFAERRFGVFAPNAPVTTAFTFDNAITAVRPAAPELLADRRPRRLLFYARPEPHAARNMFELGVLALQRALDAGTFGPGWELHGIGGLGAQSAITLRPGATLRLVPRSRQIGYGELLAEYDVGLALMYTPHPSLVPIEMASAGMVTVTNRFENKTPQRLQAISDNLLAPEPTIEAIADALGEATRRAEDVAARVRGAEVRWSSDWNASFDDALLDALVTSLG